MKNNAIKIYFLIFILISAAYIVSLTYTSARYASGEKAVATVTEVEHKTIRKHHTKGGSTKRNVTNITYEYSADGNTYTNTIKQSGKKRIEQGDIVKIAYAADNPQKAYLFDQITWQIIPTLFWIIITVAQLILYLRFCRSKPDGPRDYETNDAGSDERT